MRTWRNEDFFKPSHEGFEPKQCEKWLELNADLQLGPGVQDDIKLSHLKKTGFQQDKTIIFSR